MMVLFRRLIDFLTRDPDAALTDEERRARAQGYQAYLDGWHENMYPSNGALGVQWQIGHDKADEDDRRAY